MEIASALGFIGALLTTAAFIPQVHQSWTTKKTHDLSLGWIVCLIGGFSSWLAYGWLIKDMPLIFANTFSLVLVVSLLWMKLKWGMGKDG